MNQEDIIRMAREAWYAAGEGWVVEQWFHDRESALTRFAALVAAAKDEEHKEAMRDDHRKAITAIREALAEESSGTEQPAHSEAYWQHEVNNAYANGYTKGRASCLHDEKMKSKQPAQPQREPVAWMDRYGELYKNVEQVLSTDIPLYPFPPAQRKPLTGEEMNQIEARWDASMHGSKIAFVVRETEAAHGIKENT